VSANVQLTRAWIRAINEGDTERWLGLVTPDFELIESSTLPGAAQAYGPEGLRRYAAGWARNWSAWELREVEIVDVPPTRVVLAADLKLRGRHSGIDVERRWVYLLSVRDGKLASQIGFDDKDEALRVARSG
jgi:ketosteroid isomerase-like protein